MNTEQIKVERVTGKTPDGFDTFTVWNLSLSDAVKQESEFAADMDTQQKAKVTAEKNKVKE